MEYLKEKTADEVYRSMMELEAAINRNKKSIREDNFNEEATMQFSLNVFNLFVKRAKHGFFKKGEFDKGNRLEELLIQNSEPISHKISSSALTVAMNTTLYDRSLDDTFMELLKDYAEYLKPILLEVFNNT
jgi:hypothetical protein